MNARKPLGLFVFLAVLALASAFAMADPPLLVNGDRIEGTLLEADDEAGFTFDALAGSEVKVSIKATNDSGLEPELLMAGPNMVRVEMGPAYRHKDGSKKTKLKTFELPTTGRHTLVVRGLKSTTGTFKLKFKLEHPRKFKATGLIEFSFATSLTRFSAFEDSQLKFKVKGRSGFIPRVRSLLQPDVNEVTIDGVTYDGATVRGSDYVCPEMGEYRLRIEAASPQGGEWKSKIKMIHPETAPSTRAVTGEDEGTYTDQFEEAGSNPSLPLVKIEQTAEFRHVFSILNPSGNGAYTAGQSVGLMMTLQSLAPSDVTIRMNRDPWHNIIVRSVGSNTIVWQLVTDANFSTPFVTFPWADTRSWSTLFYVRDQSGAALPPGEYDIVATIQTEDTRMPSEVRHRIVVQ